MYAARGEVLHFSQDPGITRFVPHRAVTATQSEPYVWAVDTERSPDYWFPRDCPRVLAWADRATSPADRALLGPAERVHVVEHGWAREIARVTVYAYRFDAADFEPIGQPAYAWVATREVHAIGPPVEVTDLLAVHAAAGIELRAVGDLRPYVEAWMGTTLGCSAIRLGGR